MIPHRIHYCWFGGKPLPKSAIKCIDSWKKFFPGYDIVEHNESNYDVNKIPYIQQAYASGKYAFVSDYVRFDILYHQGGLYFDTDVEVIKPFDDILSNGSFMGCEIDPTENEEIKVAPGLGLAAEPGLNLYRSILDFYENQSFLNSDGTINQETVVEKTTKVLFSYGLKNECGIQRIGDVIIYPKEYFNPVNNNTGKIIKTINTHSIHWYSMSWMDKDKLVKSKITRIFHRIFGEHCFDWIKKKRF